MASTTTTAQPAVPTTLVEIPNTTALHIPTPASDPLPLSAGTLVLTALPPVNPKEPAKVTLSVGASSFELHPNTPVQKILAKEEHPTYVFAPVSPEGGSAVGQVKLLFRDSKNQVEWDALEALVTKFEAALKQYHVWDQKILFVNDEFERPPNALPSQGWGEQVAGSITSASHALAKRLNAFTDSRVAGSTHAGAVADKHEDFKTKSEGNWAQLNVAAKGLASAAGTFAGSVGSNAQKAYSHYTQKPEGTATTTGAAANDVELGHTVEPTTATTATTATQPSKSIQL